MCGGGGEECTEKGILILLLCRYWVSTSVTIVCCWAWWAHVSVRGGGLEHCVLPGCHSHMDKETMC